MVSNNSKLLIVLSLFSTLLLFGCLNGNTPNQNPQPSPSPTPNAAPPSPNPNPSSNPTPATTPTNPTPSPAPNQNLNGLAYGQLIALGIPLECNIRSTYSGTTTTIHVYMNGNRQVRSEIGAIEGSRCAFVGVLKDNKMYLGCSSGSYIQNCDWLTLDVDPSTLNDTSNPSQTPSMDYGNIPPADIQCNPWILDTSKFATPGRICDMNNLGAAGGYGAYQ